MSFAPVYQADLAKIGVTLNIRALELAIWVDEAVNRKYKGMYLSNSTFAQLEPSSTLSNGRATDPNSNNSLFKDDQYSQLIATAASEPDASKRKAIYSQLNDILLDESFIMVLAGSPPTLALRPNVHGVEAQCSRWFLLSQRLAGLACLERSRQTRILMNKLINSPQNLGTTAPMDYIYATKNAGYEAIGIRLYRAPGRTYNFNPIVGNPTPDARRQEGHP